SLPDLSVEQTVELAWRADAIAVAPDGERIVLLQSGTGEGPRLWLWSKSDSKSLAAAPDLSTRLAWIDESKIAYENRERQLCLIDAETGETTFGLPGHWPRAAQRTDQWYAITGTAAVAFSIHDSGHTKPGRIEGISFGRVT